MQIELQCPSCSCRFGALANTPATEILDRLTEDGPWFALADGDTFDDMVSAAVSFRGAIWCPICRAIMDIVERDAAEPEAVAAYC